MIKDDFSPEEKQVDGLNDLGFIPIKDKAPTPTTRSWFGKDIISDYVRFDKGNFLLHSPAEDVDRFFAGRDKNGEYVVKLSKPGIDAEEATNSQVLFSTNVIFFQSVIALPTSTPLSDYLVTNNLVWYSSALELNFAPILSFYKETDWTITAVQLRTKWTNGRAFNGATWNDVNPTNVAYRMNATKSAALGNTTHSYYTWSSGTALTTGQNPVNGTVIDITFDNTQIAAITNGWNGIVFQAETTSDLNQGYIDAQIYIRGYINL